MEFTSDKIIKYLQNKMNAVKEKRDENVDCSKAMNELIICWNMAEKITGKKVAVRDYKVAWAD